MSTIPHLHLTMRRLLALLVCLTLAACGGSASQTEGRGAALEGTAANQDAEPERGEAAEGKTARVTEVIDGDTIELEGVGRVRLIGGLSRLFAG